MDEFLVYRKTGAGAAQLAMPHGALAPAARRVLILLDGRRTIAELADLFGMESVQRLVAELEAKGFARQVDLQRSAQDADVLTGIHPHQGAGEQAPVAPARPSRRGPWLLLAGALALAAAWQLAGRPNPSSYTQASRVSPAEASAQPAASAAGGDQASPAAEPAPPVTAIDAPPVRTGGAVITLAPPRTARLPTPVIPTAPRSPAPALSEPPVARAADAPATSVPAAGARIENPARSVAAAPSNPAPAAPAAAAPVASLAAPVAAQVAAPAPLPVVAVEATRDDTAAGTTAAGRAPASPLDSPAALALAARPSDATSAPVKLRPLKHEPPEFPIRALRNGIEEGHVQARLWISAEGAVEQVDIVSATPPRVFDAEVRRALSLWTFEAPGRPRQETILLTFKP